MRSTPALALLALAACGGSGGGGGTYVSVTDAELSMNFKSGGVVDMIAQGMGSSSGTYTVDGEKLLVTVSGATHTFVKDGNCIEDQLHVFGKLCKGGKAGEASNVSTRSVPSPSGTWVASTTEGTFTVAFKGGNTVTLSATAPGQNPESHDGTFTVEGDMVYAQLPGGMPLALKFVNNAYESTSFGFPMKFVKQ